MTIDASIEVGTQTFTFETLFSWLYEPNIEYQITSVTGDLTLDGDAVIAPQTPQTISIQVHVITTGVEYTEWDSTLLLEVTPGVSKTYIGVTKANVLDGGAGNDVLDGRVGADKMFGGTGNDVYIVDDLGDIVSEQRGSGQDWVKSSINFNLADDTHVIGSIEHLRLTGNAVTGIGNDHRNVLVGNSAANSLLGGAGSDTLMGMGGHDKLTGGIGNDSFVFNDKPISATRDYITDFSHADDRIKLNSGFFENMNDGYLRSRFFHIGTKAHYGDDHIIYNKATGALYYDSDGTGAHAQVQFATLLNRPSDVTNTDFMLT